mmetsp:Transcript_22199/g.62991  ORF Transcript_22199/g.62991 Transcript_22199/m.62991 type:complete len:1352 (+) Transcript_22199:327-4382(+)
MEEEINDSERTPSSSKRKSTKSKKVRSKSRNSSRRKRRSSKMKQDDDEGSISHNNNSSSSSILMSPGAASSASSSKQRKKKKKSKKSKKTKKSTRTNNDDEEHDEMIDDDNLEDEDEEMIDDDDLEEDEELKSPSRSRSSSRNNKQQQASKQTVPRPRRLPEGLKLISVPSQEKIDFSIGDDDDDSEELVYPTRGIVPLAKKKSLDDMDDDTNGKQQQQQRHDDDEKQASMPQHLQNNKSNGSNIIAFHRSSSITRVAMTGEVLDGSGAVISRSMRVGGDDGRSAQAQTQQKWQHPESGQAEKHDKQTSTATTDDAENAPNKHDLSHGRSTSTSSSQSPAVHAGSRFPLPPLPLSLPETSVATATTKSTETSPTVPESQDGYADSRSTDGDAVEVDANVRNNDDTQRPNKRTRPPRHLQSQQPKRSISEHGSGRTADGNKYSAIPHSSYHCDPQYLDDIVGHQDHNYNEAMQNGHYEEDDEEEDEEEESMAMSCIDHTYSDDYSTSESDGSSDSGTTESGSDGDSSTTSGSGRSTSDSGSSSAPISESETESLASINAALFSKAIHTDYDRPRPRGRNDQSHSHYSFSTFSQIPGADNDDSKRLINIFPLSPSSTSISKIDRSFLLNDDGDDNNNPNDNNDDANNNGAISPYMLSPMSIPKEMKELSNEAPHLRQQAELSDGSDDDSFYYGDDQDDPNDYRKPSTGYPEDDDIYSKQNGEDNDEDSVDKHLVTAGVNDNSERQDRTFRSEQAPSSYSSRGSQNNETAKEKNGESGTAPHWSKPGAYHEEEDGDLYSYDSREEGEIEEQERYQRRRKFSEIIFAAVCCCILLGVIIFLIVFFVNRSNNKNDSDKSATNETSIPTRAPVVFVDDVDDDYIYQPLLLVNAIITTDMAPANGGCDQVITFPNVLDQCICSSSITILPDDVVRMHARLSDELLPFFYPAENGTAYSEEITSCAPSNLALVWLASGNMRDSGYLRQRFALATMYYAMQGLDDRRWDYSDAWLSELNECLWLGVQCNNQDVVNSLALDTNNVYGTLPTEIAKLDGLAALSLSRNHLSGNFPTEIFSLPRLKELRLYANQLRGRFPTEVGMATSLKSLLIQDNNHAGAIPSELGLLTQLTELDAGSNQFRQSIPSELGKLVALKVLRLNDNRLSGSFPSEMGNLISLQNITLSSNTGLTGSLPTTFGKLTDILDISIVNTGMGGTLPSEMGQLVNLYRIDLVSGNFAGGIPTEWGDMVGLHFLVLTDNPKFRGTIPTELGKLTNLIRFQLNDNLWTGTLPRELGNLKQLEVLDVKQTNLQGSVPQELCSLRTGGSLESFAVPCSGGTGGGMQCEIPSCCTRCRSRDDGF